MGQGFCDRCGAFAFFGCAAPAVCPFCAAEDETEPRAEGCECQWEAGDSPCPVHGDDEGQS